MKELKYIFIYLLWIAFCYLLMAFYKITFDFTLWDKDNRYVIIFMATSGLMLGVGVFVVNKENT